jgi:hypothetical protein
MAEVKVLLCGAVLGRFDQLFKRVATVRRLPTAPPPPQRLHPYPTVARLTPHARASFSVPVCSSCARI